MGVLDEVRRSKENDREFRGIDGPFIYYATVNHELDYEQSREMTEFLVDHDVIHRILLRKKEEVEASMDTKPFA